MSSPSPRSLPSGLYIRGIVVSGGEDVFARALFCCQGRTVEGGHQDQRLRNKIGDDTSDATH